MDSIILPNKYEFNAPWHLDMDNFNNLINTVNSIIKIIEKENSKYYEKEIIYKLENNYFDTTLNIEQKRIIAEERCFYMISDYTSDEYYINTKQGKTISDKSLENLIKVHSLEEYEAKSLIINIKRYFISFEIKIDTKRNLLTYCVDNRKINNQELSSIIQTINYEMNDWIEKNRPNIIERVWSNYYSLFPMLLFIFATFFITISFLSETTNIDIKKYKEELKKEALVVLENGIQKDEIEKTLEIILKNQINFVPQQEDKYEIEYNNLKFLLLAVFIAIILEFKPISIIGLGKNKKKVKIYRTWYKFVIYFFPIIIFIPYVINKLSSI